MIPKLLQFLIFFYSAIPHYRLLVTKSLPTKCLCCWQDREKGEFTKNLTLRGGGTYGQPRKDYEVKVCTEGEVSTFLNQHLPVLAVYLKRRVCSSTASKRLLITTVISFSADGAPYLACLFF